MNPDVGAAADNLIFRNTNGKTGRHLAVTPDNSSMRHLCYGRIILEGQKRSESFSTGDRETGLICLDGEATLTIGREKVSLARFDSVYVPRDSMVEVTTGSSVDLAEFSSDISGKYPLQVV